MLGFVSLWRSEGHECQRPSRAECNGTTDNKEEHGNYKSISDAGAAHRTDFLGYNQGAETVRFTGFPSQLPPDSQVPKQVLPNYRSKYRLYRNIDAAQDADLAPAVGFEPTTNRLTADRSTTELRWIAT